MGIGTYIALLTSTALCVLLALTRGGILMIFSGAGRHWFVATVALVFACGLSAAAQGREAYRPPALDSVHAIAAAHGMVVAQEKIAARVGADVLKRGGNAVDAAVATAASTALPPRLSTSPPIRAAIFSCATTMPCSATTG